jgi:hypothetical protein
MSKLSEFCDDLRTVKPGQQAEIPYEGCVWLLSEIDRLQNVAKLAVEAEVEANQAFVRLKMATDESSRRF